MYTYKQVALLNNTIHLYETYNYMTILWETYKFVTPQHYTLT